MYKEGDTFIDGSGTTQKVIDVHMYEEDDKTYVNYLTIYYDNGLKYSDNFTDEVDISKYDEEINTGRKFGEA